MSYMPSLFVSHGSPETAIRDTPASRSWTALGEALPRLKAILVVSAHWETATPTVATADEPPTVYDFGGFDPRLRRIRYDAPGAPEISRAAARLLASAGFQASEDARHGWDHGVWVPLQLIYPKRDIPVAQVSIQPFAGPRHHCELGEALRPLREQGVMILASGAMTHNLSAFRGQPVDAPVLPWVSEFNEWMADALVAGRREDLLDYRTKAPHGRLNHPEEEHLLPLFVALGAMMPGERVERLHASYEHAVLAMDVYRFG